jgi:hypothetical protein
MKSKLVASLVAVAGVLFVSSTLWAHHGTSVTYQVDKAITLNGTVTAWDFAYPHPQLYFDVQDEGRQRSTLGL